MPTQDISRHLHQPEKHYAGVRMQQGRVILDSDWNERAMIEAEDLRRTIRELACAKGTPNAGMKIAEFDPETFDFQITNGSYYLGGMRLVVDAADGWETFKTQTDWLQVDALDGNALAAPEGDRIDLIYVMAWEQTVSAVEDSELLEAALGGRDTSVRMRRMRRFEVLKVADSNPATFDATDAFESLLETLETDIGEFDDATHEWRSNGRLRVAATEDPAPSEDPCTISEVEGYVGADNRAIRVELRSGNKLTWGFDNASPLYRVKRGAGPDVLVFLTMPADVAAMPRAGQVVELHRWGSKLPNVEKVAEPQGRIYKVQTTYDPTTQQLVLDGDIPADWLDWLDDHAVHYNPDDDEDAQKYFYLRVWDRGDASGDAEVEYELGTPITLGATGLTATVEAHGIPGDHWILAARPTADKLMPWDLATEGGVAPHGPHRYVAPLALVRWTAGVPTLEDARTRLRTLCEGGCCQVTVGDGSESHGMVQSLQEAVQMLQDTGGKICVLAGTHEGLVSLDGISNLVIEGCGPRTILTNPRPELPRSNALDYYTPVISILDSHRITIKDLRIEAYSAAGIEAKISAAEATCTRLHVENVDFHALGRVQVNNPGVSVLEPPHTGLAAYGLVGLDVFDCRFTSAVVPGLSNPLVLGSEQVRVHRCEFTVELTEDGHALTPGGIHVRSQARDVEILGCRIEGGWGHGIALGHVVLRERSEDPVAVDVFGAAIQANTLQPLGQLQISEYDGCGPAPDDLLLAAPDLTEMVWLPAGPIENLRILDNVIRGMGLSGISTSTFLPAAFDWNNDGFVDNVPRFIVTAEVEIARNLIEENVQNARLSVLGFQDFDVAVGGVVLAASVNAWIHDNTIRGNGSVGYVVPICGIGMLAAQNAVIEDNRIVDNGAKHPGSKDLPRALRGGIAIYEAMPVRSSDGQPSFPVSIANITFAGTKKNYLEASAESAVIVRGNEVSQPVGKALWVRRGFGAVTVTGNSLEGFGDPVDGVAIEGVALRWKKGGDALTLPARGGLVEIIDYGYAFELASPVEGTPVPSWCDPSGGTVRGGAVLFNGNTCRLDWRVLGGCAAGVAVSSLDAVSVCGNVMTAEMHTDYGVTIELSEFESPIDSFMKDIFAAFSTMSFLLTHVYAGAAGTVLVQGNRVIEGKFDALFSVACSAALSPAESTVTVVTGGVMLMANVLSHCRGIDEDFTAFGNQNISIHKSETLGAECPYEMVREVWMSGRNLTITVP